MKQFYKVPAELLLVLFCIFSHLNNYGQAVVSFDPISITTVAGGDVPAFADGTGLAARFYEPGGMVFDNVSGCFYLADWGNRRIRKITTDGVVTTFAGTGYYGHQNGRASEASFGGPGSLTVDRQGNVYVSDDGLYIRKISTAGMVTTLAGNSETGYIDSSGENARFNSLQGIAIDSIGNIYAVDRDNYAIRKITPTGVVTTFTSGDFWLLGEAVGITIDAKGDMYLLDVYNGVEKVMPDGTITAVSFSSLEQRPDSLDFDHFGFVDAFVFDSLHNFYLGIQGDDPHNFIRKATPLGVSSRLAGSGFERQADGVADAAHFGGFSSLALDKAGVLYIVSASRIQRASAPKLKVFSAATNESSAIQLFRVSGNNLSDNVIVTAPNGYEIGLSPVGSFSNSLTFPPISGERPSVRIYIRLSSTATSGLHKGNITLSSGGSQTKLLPVSGYVYAPVVRFDAMDVTTFAGSGKGFTDGNGKVALFNGPRGISIDAAGNLYVADQFNNSIRKISSTATVTTFAGSGGAGFVSGSSATAQFNQPAGVITDVTGNAYVADYGNSAVRKISSAGVVSTFAGGAKGFADDVGKAAKFNNLQGIGMDTSGNIYIADAANNKIRKITSGGSVSTFAGNGMADLVNDTAGYAAFRRPMGAAVDLAGNIYVADVDNNCIRKITPDWAVTTLAGSSKGFLDGVGAAAKFNQPNGVAVDRYGNVYVADAGNNRIRKISPTGVVTTVAGSTAGFADSTGVLAKFNQPKGIAVDAAGIIYVSDVVNNRIRKISIPVPKPFSTMQGTPSAPQTALVSGLFLRANATLSAPPGFEISLSSNSGYKSVVAISPTTREIASTPVYIRLKATALAGTYNGNVTISSSGSATQKMPVTGTVVAPATDNLIAQNRINVFPNPTRGTFTIRLKDVDETDLQLKIYDANGKMILARKVNQISKTQSITVQLVNPASGIYFIQVTGRKNVFESKLIVE